MQIVKDWFQRHFSNPQVVILALVLLLGLVVVVFFGTVLAPVFAAIVVAYLLEGVVSRLEHIRIPRGFSVALVFAGFLLLSLFLLLVVVPPLIRQIGQLVQQLPMWISEGREMLLRLPEQYPQLITEEQVDTLMNQLALTIRELGQQIVTYSLNSIGGIIAILVFLVLVPVLVFFFLKDKRRILDWFAGFMPGNPDLLLQVWAEVDGQMGNYVRGKALEILIVGLASYLLFELLGLNFAILLATVVGVSTIIPYIGVVLATIPIALVGFFQWGFSLQLLYVLVGYFVIEALDGNLLVPVLFSGVVNLHPVAIIVAVLVFGGIWGIWGVFFAIPLATLVHAVLRAWPTTGPETAGAADQSTSEA